MIRLFIDQPFKIGEKLVPSVAQSHYLCHVMRLKEKDEVICFNGCDGEWSGEIFPQKKQVFLILKKQIKKQVNLPQCVLCPSLIKKESMDFVFQKATELGVTDIYPIIASRSVVKNFNQAHAMNIIYEACEQCERLDIPHLNTPNTLENVMQKLSGKTHFVWMSERGKTCEHSSQLVPAFFIGPEGGWTDQEQKLLRDANASEWHIGQTILRAETASIAAVAIYQAQKK